MRAMAIIQQTLEDAPLSNVSVHEDAYELLTALKGLYEPRGFSSEFQICRNLFTTTLQNSGNIENYLSKIHNYTTELKNRDLKIPDQVIVAYTLENLTPQWGNTVAIITQSYRDKRATEIDVSQLFMHLLDEGRRQKKPNKDVDMALLGTQPNQLNQPKQANKGKKSLICDYCKKRGHKALDCWEKHPEKRPYKGKNKPEEALVATEEICLHTTLGGQSWFLDSAASSHISSNKDLF